MNKAGGNELGYASRAILSALLDELISSQVISPSAATVILDRAEVSLQSLGNNVSAPGAIAVVKDIRKDLARHDV